jgi:prepilin-type N-terminal cleavage/methylation domain-containing protein
MARKYNKNVQGFSLAELLIALAIVGILMGVALPHAQVWISQSGTTASARGLFNLLREAKSLAAATNVEHRVEFDVESNRYRLVRGNRSINSDNWDTVVYDWTKPEPGVVFETNKEFIHMNTDGTSNAGSIKFNGKNSFNECKIIVASSGRIRIPS